MTISVQAYRISATKTRWNEQNTAGTNGSNRSNSAHAERLAYGSLSSAESPYLIVQNAFPCSECSRFFLRESTRGHAIILKVTANEGGYEAEFAAEFATQFKGATEGDDTAKLPLWLYYYGGKLEVANEDQATPTGFPEHPLIEPLI